MGKKGKKSEEVETQPRVRDYVIASWGLFIGWLKRHKNFTAFTLMTLILVVAWLGYLIVQDRSELTNNEVVISVNKQLGLTESNPDIFEVIDEDRAIQPFLEDAKNGDKLLRYFHTGTAVLFRPNGEQIIRKGVFTPPDAKVFIRNSNDDDGALFSTIEELEKIDGISYYSSDKTKNDYNNTLVVSVTDRYPEQAEAVAKALNAEIVRLPQGESVPDADILVIVGK